MIAEREPANSSMGVATLLRETRIKLGRDINVAATTLRIRQPYLQAIEEGRFQDLPGSTYAVGFVRGYAEYLGLDGVEIVRRFKQENGDLSERATLVFPSATSGGGIPTSALLGFAVVGALVAYGVWYWLQERSDTVAESVPPLPERLAALIHKPVETPAETAPAAAPAQAPAEAAPQTPATVTQEAAVTPPPPAAEAPPPVAEAQPAPQPEPVAAAPEPVKPAKPAKTKKVEAPPPAPAAAPPAEGDNPAAAAGSAVAVAGTETPAAAEAAPPKPEKVVWKASKRVKITASADCWVKIRDANGQVVLSRLLHAGDTFTPPGNPGLVMTVGNAGALTMVVDGRERPPLGAEGVVKRVALDPDKQDDSAPAETPAPSSGPNE